MSIQKKTTVTRYHYDPLDKLVGISSATENVVQRFYAKDRLTTETQGDVQRSIFAYHDRLLAHVNRRLGGSQSTLLATDLQQSVLQTLSATQNESIAYTPYGHRSQNSPLLGFNGERPDPTTGHYLLGNGYRAFNPVLMRFNRPDSMSPFGKGGLNAYAYCAGNPINIIDPTGHFLMPILRNAAKKLATTVNDFMEVYAASMLRLTSMILMSHGVGVTAYSLTAGPRGAVHQVAAALGISLTVVGAAFTALSTHLSSTLPSRQLARRASDFIAVQNQLSHARTAISYLENTTDQLKDALNVSRQEAAEMHRELTGAYNHIDTQNSQITALQNTLNASLPGYDSLPPAYTIRRRGSAPT